MDLSIKLRDKDFSEIYYIIAETMKKTEKSELLKKTVYLIKYEFDGNLMSLLFIFFEKCDFLSRRKKQRVVFFFFPFILKKTFI